MESISIAILIISFMLHGNSNVNAKNSSEIAFSFEDLDNYALLEIFDTLEFEELLHLADTNSRIRELITRHHMMNKFHIHERILKIGASPNNGLFNSTKIEFDNDSIMINDHVVLIRLLRNYGHLISRILFRQSEDITTNSSVWCDRVLGYINEYCSESLEELMLSGGHFSIHEWRKPFKKLNKFLLDCDEFSGGIHNLNETFPSLQYLGVRYFKSNETVFTQHFSNLVHVRFPYRYESKQLEIVKYFSELNPQLRSIQAFTVETVDDYEFMRVVSEKLKNLETIHILTVPGLRELEIQNEIEPIYFKNVKKCYLDFHVAIPNAFIFDQLEEMTILAYARPNNNITNWMNFVTKHRKLKVLNKMSLDLSLGQYLMIIDKLPDLAEITTHLENWMTDEIFVLMRQETNLKRITLCLPPNSMENGITLQNLINNPRWRIESDLIKAEFQDEFKDAEILTGGGDRYYTSLLHNVITFVKN